MNSHFHQPLQHAPRGASAVASPALHARELPAGRALSLHAAQPRELHMLQGRVWLTLDTGGVPGDHFLAAGDVLHLPAGTHAVLEAYPAQPVRWACMPVALSPASQGRFARDVRQPARDLAHALHKAFGASGRLVRGVLGYGGGLLTRRGRALAPVQCPCP